MRRGSFLPAKLHAAMTVMSHLGQAVTNIMTSVLPVFARVLSSTVTRRAGVSRVLDSSISRNCDVFVPCDRIYVYFCVRASGGCPQQGPCGTACQDELPCNTLSERRATWRGKSSLKTRSTHVLSYCSNCFVVL